MLMCGNMGLEAILKQKGAKAKYANVWACGHEVESECGAVLLNHWVWS
jgi:hypothetical protein